MRKAALILCMLVLPVSVLACGSTHTPSSTASTSKTASSSATSSTALAPKHVASRGARSTGSPAQETSALARYEPPTKLHGLREDGDRDTSSFSDGYRSADDDNDPGLDPRPNDEPEGYRDFDDLDSLRVGSPASPAVVKAVTVAVERYYAVAVSRNGARVCALLAPSFVQAAPIDLGLYGPSYMHGAKTCAALASRQFAHAHSELTVAIHITAVHLEHPDRAYAYFGSRVVPASFIPVIREGGAWKVDAFMGRPMP